VAQAWEVLDRFRPDLDRQLGQPSASG
jgi:hypothetical protein